jgi:hypothetical protein
MQEMIELKQEIKEIKQNSLYDELIKYVYHSTDDCPFVQKRCTALTIRRLS